MNPTRRPEEHLTEGDLFLLAFPPAGEPGALPPHLAACGRCSRRFAEWERAAREVAGRPGASSEGFERAVMDRIRARPTPERRSRRAWAAGLAAAAAVAGAVWVGNRTALRPAAPMPAPASAMGARDLADDALLRDVARLVDGDDAAGWKTMAPLPEGKEGRS